MEFRCASLVALLAWTVSVAAQPQTYGQVPGIATMPVGRTPAQIGIPSDLARHVAGRDRRVDRSTAEAAIRQMWLAVNGRVQHPSLAVQGEINRITKQYEQDQQGASLLEGVIGDAVNTEGRTTHVQKSHAATTDDMEEAIIRSQRSSFVSTQDGDDTANQVEQQTEQVAKETETRVKDYSDLLSNSTDRLDPSKGDPVLFIGDSSVELVKVVQATTESARRLGIDNSITVLKGVWDSLAK